MNNYENAIVIKGVTKRYDGFMLDNISFEVPKGCIMGFIGQNGAGKTTTIRSLLHITDIDSGEISIFGMDHIKDEAEVKNASLWCLMNCLSMTFLRQRIWLRYSRECIPNGITAFTLTTSNASDYL